MTTKLERQNGAKCSYFPKNRQKERRERGEMVVICLLYDLFFARTEWEIDHICKIKKMI